MFNVYITLYNSARLCITPPAKHKLGALTYVQSDTISIQAAH